MKILVISHQAKKEGAGLFLSEATEYMISKGHQVVAVFPQTGNLSATFERMSVTCYYVPNTWWTRKGFKPDSTPKMMSIQADRILDIIKAEKPDLIYTNTIVDIAGAIAAAKAGLPHIWHFHELPYLPDAIEMAIPKQELARLISNTTNLVVCNSDLVYQEWKDDLKDVDMLVVKNWLNGNEEYSSERTIDTAESEFFIQVATILSLKGQLDTVRAFHELINEGFDYQLYLIGPVNEEAYYNEVKEYIDKNDLNHRILFTGYIENPFLKYKNAKASIGASVSESFGRTTIEAMHHKIPVIGAAGGGNLGLIEHQVSGLLYKHGDIQSMKEQMKKLCIDNELRNRLIIGGISVSDRYTSASAQMEPLIHKMGQLKGQFNPSWPLYKYYTQTPPTDGIKTTFYLLILKILYRLKKYFK